jgi:exoribonuclease II
VITDGGDSEVVESGTVAAAAAAAQTLDQRLRKGAAPLHVGREPQMRDRAHAVSLVEPEERGELQNITLRLAVDDRKLEVEENGLVQLRVPKFCSARAARLAAANLSSSSTRPPAIDTLQENKKLCWLQRRMRMQGS